MRDKEDISFEESIFDDWSGSARLESPMPRGAFFLVAFFAGVLIFAFALRFSILSFAYGVKYAARAEANVNKQFILPAYRGIITDRFNEVLVKNIPSFTVSVDIGELYRRSRTAESRAILIRKIAAILFLPSEAVNNRIESGDMENVARVIIARDVSAEQAIALRAITDEALVVEDDYRREYPEPFVFSPIRTEICLSHPVSELPGPRLPR